MYVYRYANTDIDIKMCIDIDIRLYIYKLICHFGRTSFRFLQRFEEFVIKLEFWNLDLDSHKISSYVL